MHIHFQIQGIYRDPRGVDDLRGYGYRVGSGAGGHTFCARRHPGLTQTPGEGAYKLWA